MTSFGVVARVRRLLTQQAGRRIKVGHCGTLDPFATGLLILVTGKKTKLANSYAKKDKEYIATLELGATSNTGDPEGDIIRQDILLPPTEQQIKEAVDSFVGSISQTPPKFSAIKVRGQRAYKLARAGQDFSLKPREVNIYSIEILKYKYPLLTIKTRVSSGTYIRTLGEDIGRKLGTGAYLVELRRTKIADYSVDDAEQLDNRGEIW